MEVMDAMSRRRSCRAYLPQQILNEKRDEILKAANAAPVGMGEYQNVRLSVIQSAALLEKLDRCGAAFLGDPSLRPTYGAPTVILVSVSRDSKQDAAYCNAACIVENMHLAATDLGLGSVYLLGCGAAAGAEDPRGLFPRLGSGCGVLRRNRAYAGAYYG